VIEDLLPRWKAAIFYLERRNNGRERTSNAKPRIERNVF
jgi:hypothetical protein